MPGGRTLAGLVTGSLAMRWRAFAAWDALAGALWGRLPRRSASSGRAAEDDPEQLLRAGGPTRTARTDGAA
jgi:hypothetical protein